MQMNSGQPERTTTGTFRISEKVYGAMQKEAEERRVSLNSVVNQVLYEHAFEPIPVMNPAFVAMPRSLYSDILSLISDEDARQLGQSCAQRVAKSFMLARHATITVETIAETMRSYAERAGYGRYSEAWEDGKRIVTIMHEFGPKHSESTAAYAEALFQLVGLRPAITITDGAVVIKI